MRDRESCEYKVGGFCNVYAVAVVNIGIRVGGYRVCARHLPEVVWRGAPGLYTPKGLNVTIRWLLIEDES